LQDLGVQIISDKPQDLADSLSCDSPFAEAETLIQDGKGVTHSAIRMTRDQRQRIVIGSDSLGREHMPKPFPDCGGAYSPEIEPLKPRHDGGGGGCDFLRLCGREDKHYTRRRLLQNFEESVPCFARQHVCFIDDVDLVMPLLGRGVHGSFPQVTSVLYTPVAGGIDLDHIDVG
jgi:hypothetical protein